MEAFGLAVYQIDGNDATAIIETIESLPEDNGIPKAIIANTTKGKGVSFIEGQPSWHHRIPTGDELPLALEELE
jgi:transketolase